MTWLPNVDPRRAGLREQKMSRARRVVLGGEYVIHLASDGSQQVLFMKFQDMPEVTSLGAELTPHSTGPELRGLMQEFEVQPEVHRDGGDAPSARRKGSQFVIQGFIYNVIKVDPTHLGNLKIMLTQDRNCALRDFEFFDHVRPYICWDAQK